MALKGVIFDIDGVLEYQGVVYPGAVEVVQALRTRGLVLRCLTNSTLKSRASCAGKLRSQGFPIQDEQVITASYAAARYLDELRPRSVWVLQERAGLDEFQAYPQDRTDPEVIVIGDNRSCFDFDTLNQVLRLLKKGAKLVGMQNELVDGSLGDLELNVGSWVGMLERASGVPATYIGKPFPYAFELTLRSMGLDRTEVVMVGDRISSDILGAANAGMASVLVKTGEFHAADLDGTVRPTAVVNGMADLLACLDRLPSFRVDG